MGAENIIINGTGYPVVYNFNTYRTFANKYRISNVNDIGKVFEVEGEMTFEQMDKQVDFILSALKEGARLKGETIKLSLEDIYAEMSTNPSFMEQAIGIFVNSLPKPDTKSEKKN